MRGMMYLDLSYDGAKDGLQQLDLNRLVGLIRLGDVSVQSSFQTSKANHINNSLNPPRASSAK